MYIFVPTETDVNFVSETSESVETDMQGDLCGNPNSWREKDYDQQSVEHSLCEVSGIKACGWHLRNK